MTNTFDAEFVALSVVLPGIKDIRETVERAEQFRARGRCTLMSVDKIHRFNKSQQNASLLHVESGLLTFIGATTENPSFEVSDTLLLRTAMHVLKSLSDDELKQPAKHARQELGKLEWTPATLNAIVASADGDGRKLLNNIRIVARAARTQADGDATPVTDETLLVSALSEDLRRFDKGGDAFYGQVSALHKSVRGSDPDGASYWFCRTLDGSAGPRYLVRRIVRMAWEDIGSANPSVGRITSDTVETYEHLGSPEGEPVLAQVVIYLTITPGPNTGYNAYNATRAFASQGKPHNMSMHLRSAPTRLMRKLDYGHAYRYAHDEPKAYAAGGIYFPDDLPVQSWYVPTPRGLEGKIDEKLRHLRGLGAQ